MRLTKRQIAALMEQADQIFEARGVPEEEQDMIWWAMAAFCEWQLRAKQGPFYDVATKWITEGKVKRPRRKKGDWTGWKKWLENLKPEDFGAEGGK